MQVSWTIIKEFCSGKDLSVQWIDLVDSYELKVSDGIFNLECNLTKSDVVDTLDFESNHKNHSNKKSISEVVTQYELNDKTLKLARAKAEVDSNGTAILYLKVPGQFGSGEGRFVLGGYGISEDYNKDDYIIVKVEDKDRIIAWMIAQSIDPDAIEPVSDEIIQQMGTIPGMGTSFPNYPIVSSYSDEEVSVENCGWYFWPNAQGNNLPPVGEVEVNPIGGYGFIPSGFYIKLVYQRPEGVTTGSLRANIDWGRKE